MTVKGSRELMKREKPGYLSPFYEFERWLEDVWKRPFSLFGPSLWPDLRVAERYEISPSVDMYEEGNELIVKADLPGIKKDDLSIDLAENILTITGEKKKEEKTEREDYYRYERSFGKFSRRFELPGDLESEKIHAHFEDGVLEVRIPKTKESEKKHKKVAIE